MKTDICLWLILLLTLLDIFALIVTKFVSIVMASVFTWVTKVTIYFILTTDLLTLNWWRACPSDPRDLTVSATIVAVHTERQFCCR
jgi:hypothetical protein